MTDNLIKQINTVLLALFESAMREEYIITNYDDVDEFYAYLGYDLEAQQLLLAINVNGTSDLQEALIQAKNKNV